MRLRKAQVSGGVILLIIVIIGFFAIWYVNPFGVKEKMDIKTITSKVSSGKNTFESYQPATKLFWCIEQDIDSGLSEYNAKTIKMLGEDNVNNCCVKRFEGHNNCLNQSETIDMCYTSSIGGEIKWIKINNKFKNPRYYDEYISNLNKVYNPTLFEKCDKTIYGG